MPIAILFMFVALAIITPVMIHGIQQNNQLILGTVTARQMHQVTKAAQDYITAYATNIEASSTATTPATITIPMLESTGFLPSGFQSTNPYGQTWEVQVLQPNPGQLQALVLSLGGQTILPADGPRIGAEAGSRGGTVTASGTAQGSYAGWQVSLANYTNPGVGHLASLLYFNNGSLENDYLYRVQVPGQPQLNTMSTDLNMGANDINNAQNVNVNQNIVAGPAGGGCVIDADGHCTGQVSAAGASETDLPANWDGGMETDDLHADDTIAAGAPGQVAADISDYALGAYDTGGRAWFMSPNGANTVQITAPHGGPAEVQTNGILSGQVLYPGTNNGQANIGWGCGPNGAISGNANGTGQTLSCVNGTWQTPAFSPYEAASYYFAWNTEGTFNIWTTTIGPFALCAVEGQGGNYPSISLNISGGSPGAYYWYFYANGGGNYWGATVACFD